MLRIYLPVFLVIYLLVTFVIPTWRVYRQTGINPVTFKKKDNAHDYIGQVMKVLMLLLVAAVAVYAFAPSAYPYLVPVRYLQNKETQWAGLILMHASLLWLMIAQYQMSRSWRIGIDEQHKTTLVTEGLFSLSRNPIFLGMIVSVTGLLLVLPNALLFAVWMATYIIIQVQIRLEEDFLGKAHGAAYADYRKKVRRMI